jgi:hypothetical protein
MLVKTSTDAGAHGCSFFLVPTKTKGFHVSKKLKKIGNHSSDTAELFFEDMRIPKRYLLGEEGMGFMYLMQNFQSERIIACTSACAGGALMMEEAIAYGRDRKAFGKPIIKREYWQHKFVDMTAKLAAAKALTYQGVEMYNHDKYVKKDNVDMETVKAISLSKIFVGDVVSEIADQCLQFHGGWGYIEEFHIARAWRDQRPPAPVPPRGGPDGDDAVLRGEVDGAVTEGRRIARGRASARSAGGAPRLVAAGRRSRRIHVRIFERRSDCSGIRSKSKAHPDPGVFSMMRVRA